MSKAPTAASNADWQVNGSVVVGFAIDRTLTVVINSDDTSLIAALLRVTLPA